MARVRFTADTSVRGVPVSAGEVMDVPDEDLWRLTGRCEPADEAAAAPATPADVYENADPEPKHRDPQPKRRSRA